MNKDVEEMMTVCKWPQCDCIVPDYAYSAHNRVEWCRELKKKRDDAKSTK
jgi:hypothetical protein